MSDHTLIMLFVLIFSGFGVLTAYAIADIVSALQEIERKLKELERRLTGRRQA